MSQSAHLRRAAALILLGLGATVCGTDPVAPAQPNACGGEATLVFAGTPALPGDACGPCGDGSVVCDGKDALRCAAASERNACGGCVALGNAPDTACTSEGLSGTWKCNGAEAVVCADLASGPCGGTFDLKGKPGEPCGACGLGVYVCEGADAVRCDGTNDGLNACGTCGALDATVGESCRECGGTWACGDDGQVVCDETPRNACGGCSALDAAPGSACTGGVWACTEQGTIECVTSSGQTNACGGEATLELVPGSACGPCGDGYAACAGADSVVCREASPLNACGACGPLQGEPGERCAGTEWRWACEADDTLACLDVSALAQLELVVEPASLDLEIGETQALEVFAVSDEGQRFPVTDEATWSSEDPSVATVDEDGGVEAMASGTTKLVVSWQSGSRTLRSEVEVEVRSASALRLSLSADRTRAPLGVAVKLTATLGTGDQAPQEVTSLVGWTVTPASTGTVSADGRFLATAIGAATIEA